MTMTTQELRIAQALDIARELVAAGIPVFAAPPDPGNPRNKVGFALPARWQQLAPQAARVDQWQPGWALCMTCGCGLDVIDIDIYAGGSLEMLAVVPVIYGRAATPSGGIHLFVAPLGVRSKNGLYPGVDVKAGDAGGNGRGFVFLAPTVKPSKVTGLPATYGWI